MGIYIRGVSKPSDCGKCFISDRTICSKGCPFIEVKEPHGKLIDADKYLNKVKYEAEGMSDDYGDMFINYTEWILGKEPEVIEAESENE